MPENNKTVFILGAGFSNPGGAPAQDKILEKIINLTLDFINTKSVKLKNNWRQFESSRTNLLLFLRKLYQCDNNNVSLIELEDIFTILDKAIVKHQHIDMKSDEELTKLRKELNFCVSYMFDAILFEVKTEFYSKLCSKIILTRINNENINNDNFSFVNLNWDLLLDNALYLKSKENNSEKSVKVAIDYCFYTDSFRKEDKDHVHHNTLKARGFKNIKVLKPHGSFNWLVCKNCGKVFIDFGNDNKIAMIEHIINENTCDSCSKPALKAVIQSPTMIKDFENVHLADILHNIQIELLEASKIVFIGYSLPLADIDFRYILKRGIRPLEQVEIEVVLLEEDPNYLDILNRYRRFFGNQLKITNNEGIGTVKYFENHSIFFNLTIT